MRQSNGTDILGVNDPRSGTIGVLYVTSDDERASVLTAILTQEKLARQVIVVVLPAQNKAFQHPVDFDGLKRMRRTMKAQLVIIAPQGSSPAEFARQRRFATFSSLDEYAQSLRVEQQEVQQQKRVWPFGRKVQLQRPDNPPTASMPASLVPPPFATPPNRQPNSIDHVDAATSTATFPPVNDTVFSRVEQLPVMGEDAIPHTDDISSPQSTVVHTDEQLHSNVQSTMDEKEDVPAQDAMVPPDEVLESSPDTPDDLAAVEEESDPDKILPRRRFTGQPSEPQPMLLTPHPSYIPQVPPDNRNVQSTPAAGSGNARRAGRPGRIGRAVGASSLFRTQLRTTRRRWLFALLILLLLLIIGGGIYTAFSVFGTEVTATVTITPVRETMQQTYSIVAVTGTPNIVQSQIEARFLSSSPPAQSETIATSGRGMLSATSAKGILTFYNSLPTAQTLPVNTLVTDAKGIEMVTDTSVVLSAAQLPVEGSAIVAAHTINTGNASNIPANDLNNIQCCASGISVTNPTAFTGGQNQRTYSYVEQSDIDGAISQLTGTLTQRAQVGVMAQILPGEQLIGSTGCVPGVTTNHSAGERAANVTVTVTETCSGEVYDQQQAHATAGNLLTATALKKFGTSYALVGNVTTMILRAMLVNPAGKVAVQVKAGGVWAYQFSGTQKSQLAHLITGKSEKDAIAALATTAGVHSVNVQVNGGDGNTLPTDTKQITIVVKT